MKRKPIKLKPDGKFATSSAMAQMRSIAYNKKTVNDTIERAERMRDDAGLAQAAEEKRLRKANRGW